MIVANKRIRRRSSRLFSCLTVVALTAAGVTTGSTAPVPAAAQTDPSTQAISITEALRTARATGKPVTATAATDWTSETIANPNGTLTKTSSLRPVRTKQDGRWVGLDATLVRNADGGYSPRAAATAVKLSGGGSGPLAELANRGHRIGLTMPVTLPAPSVAGNTATYPGVMPDVDLVVTVSPQGDFSHTFVVKTRAAAGNPNLAKLHVATVSRSLTLSSASDGQLKAADPTGRPVYTAPAAIMWDSATTAGKTSTAPSAQAPRAAESTAVEPGSGAHIAPVGVTATDTGYDLTPDQNLLTAADTVFPVMIDPTFVPNTWGATADWTEVESGKPTYAGWHQSGRAQIGYCAFTGCNGIQITRSYFQFGITPLYGTTVLSAVMNVIPEYSYNCGSQVALDWTNGISSTTNWNTKPAILATLGQKGTCDGTFGYDVTSKVQYAVANQTGISTYGIRAVDEGTSGNGWKQFNHNATLSVTWNVTPATPTGPFTSPVMPCTTTAPYPIIGTTDLYIGVQTHRATDNVAKALTATFSIKNVTLTDPDPAVGGVHKTTDINAGDWASTVIPNTVVGNGNSYKWTARVTDGNLTSGWSPECRFTVDTSHPNPPVVTSTDFPHNTTGKTFRSPGSVTFTPGPGSSQPAGYRYQFNGGIGVNVTATSGSWTGNLTPPRVGENVLTVQALSAAGTPSEVAHYVVKTAPLTTPDPAGDLNGDGKPDVLTVGGTSGTATGLWATPGTGNGRLGTPFNIGIRGHDITSGQPGDWTGTMATTGNFRGNGVQDILAITPTGNTRIYHNPGDGTALTPDINGYVPINLTDPNWEPVTTFIQITAVGHLPQDIYADAPAPDLFAVVNSNGTHQLWWFQHGPDTGIYDVAQILDPGAPTSGIDWSTKTITGTRDHGQAALLVRDKNTGQIDLHSTTCTVDCYHLNWFTEGSTKTIARPANTALTATNAPVIASNDVNNDTYPDLWAINPTGNASYGAGAANHTIAAPTATGTVLPPTTSNLTPLGTIHWKPPGTTTYQTDIYAANSSGQLLRYQPLPSSTILGPPTVVGASGWNEMTPFGIADSNHDGYPDLIVRNNIDCTERVYPGSATGFGLPVQTGVGWCGYNLYGVTDWTGDGHFDVIATDSAGNQWMYPGDLIGGGGNRVQIGGGWNSNYSPWGIVDFNGDNHPDIITRYAPDNTLKMYPGDSSLTGNGNGAVIGNGFNGTTFFGYIEDKGAGKPDKMLVRTVGTLKAYTTNGAGGWTDGTGATIANSW